MARRKCHRMMGLMAVMFVAVSAFADSRGRAMFNDIAVMHVWNNPVAATTSSIIGQIAQTAVAIASQTAVNAGATYGVSNFTHSVSTHPRNVVVGVWDQGLGTTTLTGSWTIDGKDLFGNDISETLPFAYKAGVIQSTSSKAYKSITTIRLNPVTFTGVGAKSANLTILAGVGAKFAIPVPVKTAADVILINEAGTTKTSLVNLDVTNRSFQFNTATNGTNDYEVTFRVRP